MANKIKVTDKLTQIALLLNHQLPISISRTTDGFEMEFNEDGEVLDVVKSIDTNTYNVNSKDYKKGSKMVIHLGDIINDYLFRWDERTKKDRFVEFTNEKLQKLSLRILGRKLTQTEIDNLLCDFDPNEIQKDIENKAVNLIKLISYDPGRRK